MRARTLLLTMALATLLVAGCSKSSSGNAAGNTFNLGTVELTYGTPTRKDVGNKTVCVLLAQPLNAANCEFFVSVERSGKEVGHTRLVPAAINQPAHLACGDYQIDVTPQIAK